MNWSQEKNEGGLGPGAQDGEPCSEGKLARQLFGHEHRLLGEGREMDQMKSVSEDEVGEE